METNFQPSTACSLQLPAYRLNCRCQLVPRVAFVVKKNTVQARPCAATASKGLRPSTISHNKKHRLLHYGCLQLRPRSTVVAEAAAAAAAAPLGGGNEPSQTSSVARFAQAVGKFVLDQFLPLGLLVACILGYVAPEGGLAATRLGLQTHTTTGIFIVSGLSLKRGEAAKALAAWGATLYGTVSILALTPLAALLALRLPLVPRELAIGLAVFCCMPTTLSSGVSLTQSVGGNAALALLLTVSTNLAAIFTMPFVLSAVLGTGSAAISIDPAPLLASLIRTILIPLLIGAAARAVVPGVAGAVDRNKRGLSLLSSFMLCMVPWMQISRAVTSQVSVSLGSLASVVAAGAAIHLGYLALNSTAVAVLGIGGRDGSDAGVAGIRRAVVLVGSQKTLPVAVTVVNQLGPALGGGAGLAAISCVGAHVCQILLCSSLVSVWLARDRARAADRQLKAA